MSSMTFPSYIDSGMSQTLSAMGISKLFQVQEKVFPQVVAAFRGRVRFDTCVCSPTGSGKTLAYLLPVISVLKDRRVPRLRAIIVVPRKELAKQVMESGSRLIRQAKLKVVSASGEHTIRHDQNSISDRNPDIVICTPGRLAELINSSAICLDFLRFLILDEADLLLSDNTQDWLRLVLANCSENKSNPLHRILLSATLTSNIARLNQVRLVNPKQLMLSSEGADGQVSEVSRFALPSSLDEHCIKVSTGAKILALKKILIREEGTVLVFTRSIESAHRLARLLQLMGFSAEEFSGQLTTEQRAKVIQNLREGTSACAVSSDALARGLDIDKVSVVVNYELPLFIQTYIHRTGRTARANRYGKAVTLVEEDESEQFEALRKRAVSSKPVQFSTKSTPSTDETNELSKGLNNLQAILRLERIGTLQPTGPLPASLAPKDIRQRQKRKLDDMELESDSDIVDEIVEEIEEEEEGEGGGETPQPTTE